MIEILKKAIDTYGMDHQHIMIMEECSELQKEVSKHLRGYQNEEHLLEEMCDVIIMIFQLILMHKFSKADILKTIKAKIYRLEKGLRE